MTRSRRGSGLLARAWVPEEEVPRLPYKDLSLLQKRAITNAVREAWSALPAEAARRGIELESADEDEITHLLQNELNRLLRDEEAAGRAFTGQNFLLVTRDESVPDYTGERVRKSPDLVIRPRTCPRGVARHELYGMFVECKLIGSGRSVRRYGTNGICRFVEGVYAWTMPSAMMIAYVCDGADAPGCLGPHLAVADYREQYGNPSELRIAGGEEHYTPSVYVSAHTRRFTVGRHSPGDIQLAHLWLDLRDSGANVASSHQSGRRSGS